MDSNNEVSCDLFNELNDETELDQNVLLNQINEYWSSYNFESTISMEVNNMKDIEMLRIKKLIKERESYEIEFFSMKPNDEQFYFTISQFEDNLELIVEPYYYEEELIEPYEDYIEKLRDERLIKERIAYEIEYSKNLDYKIIEMKSDCSIENEELYDKPYYNFEPDFDMYPDDFFDYCPVAEPILKKPSCYWDDMDYMPQDDFYTDCYYYPDGDLLGIYPL